jgi:hypothetical protein
VRGVCGCVRCEVSEDRSVLPPASPTKMRVLPLALLVGRAAGHGAVVRPPPRNAVDRDLPPWNGPVSLRASLPRAPSVWTAPQWAQSRCHLRRLQR